MSCRPPRVVPPSTHATTTSSNARSYRISYRIIPGRIYQVYIPDMEYVHKYQVYQGIYQGTRVLCTLYVMISRMLRADLARPSVRTGPCHESSSREHIKPFGHSVCRLPYDDGMMRATPFDHTFFVHQVYCCPLPISLTTLRFYYQTFCLYVSYSYVHTRDVAHWWSGIYGGTAVHVHIWHYII